MPARLAPVVVAVIGAALLIDVVFIGLLALDGQPVPDVMQNIAVGAVTGLLGLLVRPDTRAIE